MGDRPVTGCGATGEPVRGGMPRPGRWRRLSHEIGTPLNALSGYLEVLLDGSLGPLAPEVRSSLQHAQTAVREVRRQASLLLSLIQARSEDPPESGQAVPLRDAIAQAWQTREGWRRGDLDLAVPAGVGVLAEPEMLRAMAGLIVDLYRGAAGGGQPSAKPGALHLGLLAGSRLRIAWPGLDPAALPAIEMALLDAFARRQEGVMAAGPGHLEVCWPAARLVRTLAGEQAAEQSPIS